MDTPAEKAVANKTSYCRCGILILDGTGRIAAHSSDFGWPADLEVTAGGAVPERLRLLAAGQSVFWNDDWLVQSEGREKAELLVFRRLHTADLILGAYGESAVNEGMVEIILNNQYEGLTAVDRKGKVTFLSPANERWLGLPRGGGAGVALSSFAPGSGLCAVARTGVADSAQVVDLQGKRKITVNLPVRKEGEVIGGVGRILFQSTGQVNELADKVRAMELKVERYETLLDEMRGHLCTFDKILTNNREMLELIRQARHIAASSATVLLLGESGTGKELFAQAIHEGSRSRKGPFVAINCGAIPAELIESELFGYEEGAFSGAKKKGKPGKFELACGGTLFLDELGELPVESQAKLLRVLEERKLVRVGGTASIPLDFRLVAATNRDLATAISSGRFREDLYYRINEYPIQIPALRERREDIPLLAKHFLEEVSRRERVPMLTISDQALEALLHHPWPGNVRELRGLMRQMTWKSRGQTIHLNDLPPSLHRKSGRKATTATLEEQLVKSERLAVESALQASEGNRALAARMLGIHRTALYKKMSRLGIPCYRAARPAQ